MNTIGERFKMIIEAEKLNDFSFSKRLGKSNTAVVKIVKGESKPGFDVIEAVLSEFPHINSEWLIKGEGVMKKDVKPNEAERPDGYLIVHLENLEKQFSEMKEMFHSELAVKNRQIEKLMDLLGKPECVTETGVYKHPATAELEEGLAQRA